MHRSIASSRLSLACCVQCPQCRAQIGGHNHQLQPGQSRSQTSVPGYVLGPAATEQDVIGEAASCCPRAMNVCWNCAGFFRQMNPLSQRILRFCLHGLLLLAEAMTPTTLRVLGTDSVILCSSLIPALGSAESYCSAATARAPVE